MQAKNIQALLSVFSNADMQNVTIQVKPASIIQQISVFSFFSYFSEIIHFNSSWFRPFFQILLYVFLGQYAKKKLSCNAFLCFLLDYRIFFPSSTASVSLSPL